MQYHGMHMPLYVHRQRDGNVRSYVAYTAAPIGLLHGGLFNTRYSIRDTGGTGANWESVKAQEVGAGNGGWLGGDGESRGRGGEEGERVGRRDIIVITSSSSRNIIVVSRRW